MAFYMTSEIDENSIKKMITKRDATIAEMGELLVQKDVSIAQKDDEIKQLRHQLASLESK